MSLTLSEKQSTSATQNQKMRARIRLWLGTWELFPILLVAAILRLGGLNTTTFAGDQSVLYTLAYDAVHHGLIPTTSNSASIFTMHPPLAIYFLMLPVFFSANPLWAAVMTALFNVVAVLLAYIFMRRYYGRLAATIAALLFATAQTSIVWEIHSKFADIHTLLALTNAHAHIDSKAITYYQRFLNAYYYDDRVLGSTYCDPVGSGDSIVFRLLPLLILARYMLTFLLIAAFVMAGIMIVYSSNAATRAISPSKKPSRISLLFTRLFN